MSDKTPHCYICNCRPGTSVDHVIPKSRIKKTFGGQSDYAKLFGVMNTAKCCVQCNQTKTDCTPLEFVVRLAAVNVGLSEAKGKAVRLKIRRYLRQLRKRATAETVAVEMARRRAQSEADKAKASRRRRKRAARRLTIALMGGNK